MTDRIAQAAAILTAAFDGPLLAALPPEVAPRDEAEAYAVQTAVLRGAAVAGWKVAPARDGVIRCAPLGAARLMESSLDRLFEIAEAHPTAAVRAALFEQATAGEESVRYAFGAFLLYLHGHSDEWYGLGEEHRPHLLNLKGTPDEQAAARAWLAGMVAAPLRGGAGAA